MNSKITANPQKHGLDNTWLLICHEGNFFCVKSCQGSNNLICNLCTWHQFRVNELYLEFCAALKYITDLVSTHCVKSVQIRCFFRSVFRPNTGKYGPEKPLFLDIFHAVLVNIKCFNFCYGRWLVLEEVGVRGGGWC